MVESCVPEGVNEPRSGERSVVTGGCFLLNLLGGFGPVIAQDARKRTVGQEFVPGLATRAIVCFVGRVADALNLCATSRADLFISTVDRHPFAKCSYLFGKSIARLLTQTFNPKSEGLAGRVVQPLEFFIGKSLRELDGRESCLPQDLV